MEDDIEQGLFPVQGLAVGHDVLLNVSK